MYNSRQTRPSSNLGGAFRKLLLSAFVVFSFILYALNKSLGGADPALAPVPPGADGQNGEVINPTPTAPPDPSAGLPQADLAVTQPPAATPSRRVVIPTPLSPTAIPQAVKGQYKDGTYTGPQVNAFYGLVQVQTVIQNGKIKSVQFLQFPQDRRTSARINSFAVPILQQEAVQVQGSRVDIITGATLTSEAFIRSLASALVNAGG